MVFTDNDEASHSPIQALRGIRTASISNSKAWVKQHKRDEHDEDIEPCVAAVIVMLGRRSSFAQFVILKDLPNFRSASPTFEKLSRQSFTTKCFEQIKTTANMANLDLLFLAVSHHQYGPVTQTISGHHIHSNCVYSKTWLFQNFLKISA